MEYFSEEDYVVKDVFTNFNCLEISLLLSNIHPNIIKSSKIDIEKGIYFDTKYAASLFDYKNVPSKDAEKIISNIYSLVHFLKSKNMFFSKLEPHDFIVLPNLQVCCTNLSNVNHLFLGEEKDVLSDIVSFFKNGKVPSKNITNEEMILTANFPKDGPKLKDEFRNVIKLTLNFIKNNFSSLVIPVIFLSIDIVERLRDVIDNENKINYRNIAVFLSIKYYYPNYSYDDFKSKLKKQKGNFLQEAKNVLVKNLQGVIYRDYIYSSSESINVLTQNYDKYIMCLDVNQYDKFEVNIKENTNLHDVTVFDFLE